MKTRITTFLLLLLCAGLATSQVKIGENPDTIDAASLIELESTDKTFVLTRVDDTQMSAIMPLNGALIFNTTTQCVHMYDGSQWVNLCEASSGFSFSDNGDGTFTLNDGSGSSITWNGTPDTVTSLVDNGDGTYTYTNELGNMVTITSGSDDQNLTGVGFNPGSSELTMGIENGNSATVDLSDLEESAEIATNASNISSNSSSIAANTTNITNNTATIGTNSANIATNITNISTNTAAIAIHTTDITTNSTDIATNTTDIGTNSADIATNTTDITAHVAADSDLDATNELNSAVAFDGTNLTVTDGGGSLSADLSSLNNSGTDDQNLTGASLDGSSVLQIDIEDGASATVDLSTLEESTDIAANSGAIAVNATDIASNAGNIATNTADIGTNAADIATNTADIAAHTAADADLDATNELNSAVAFDGTTLTVTDAGGSLSTDISSLAYDDTAIQAQVATNTADIATNVTDIATNAAGITTNSTDIATNTTGIATNAADIAGHVAADSDLDATNELNSIVAFDGTNLTVTDAGGTLSADLSSLNNSGTDDQNLTGASLDGTSVLQIDIEDGTSATVDLSTLEESADIAANSAAISTNATDIATNSADIATNTTNIGTNAADIATNTADIAAHTAADADLDATNELNSAVTFDGTTLTVTDAGGSLSTDISSLAYDDTAIQAQVATNTADIATNVTDIATNAAGITTNSTDIATNTTGIATNAADIAGHVAADSDLDATNELNSIVAFDGTNLTVTDAGGSLSADLSSLNNSGTDDQNLTGASLDGSSVLQIDIEDGASATVDLSTLEESTDIAANAAAISTNATDIATSTTDIATNAGDISTNAGNIATNATNIGTNSADIAANATNITTNSINIATNTTDIATNTTDIAAHLAADGDLDATNELNSAVAFDGTNLTVTDAGGSLSTDISSLAYDDTAIQAQVATNTADIATNSTNIGTNTTGVATNATDIAAHTAADGDLDVTNELNSTVAFDGTNLTVTDAGGSLSADLSSLNNSGTDDQNLTGASLDGSSVLQIDIEDGTSATVDLSALEESVDIAANTAAILTNATDIATNTTTIATNSADIAAHVAADGDLDATNELNSAVAFDGTNLTVTDAGGSLSADISGLDTDDQSAAEVPYDNSSSGLTATDVQAALDELSGGGTTDDQTISTSGAAGNISIEDGNSITINVDDADADATNEIQTLSKTGTTISLSNGGGSVSETVTSLSQNTTSGVITYTDEATGTQTANVVSTDANNSISVGSDGGAYFGAYEKVVIWAEENGALSNNQLEWSFGNGATGLIGIPLPEAWEAYAVSFNADSNGGSDTVTMAVINTVTNTNLFTFTASGAANNMVYTQVLATPVAIPAGTSIGFRTVTEVGNVSDARVAVWLRRRP